MGERSQAEVAERVGHTPGPWRIEKPEDELLKFRIHCIGDRPTVEIWADGAHAAQGFYHPVALVADDDVGNARLIAAAPDMLAALHKIASGTKDEEPPFTAMPREEMVRIARAAIDKAHGR